MTQYYPPLAPPNKASQEVTHPGTTLVEARLTAKFWQVYGHQVVTNGIGVITQLDMGGAYTSPWGLPVGTRWDAKNRVIPWGSPAGMLGPKRGWLWRLKSPRYENGYVLICIFAPFLTQRVLKLWWPWTYQNCAVKYTSARLVPKWVSSIILVWRSQI